MGTLESAIKYATDKHAGMVRKGTQSPFIVHPLEALAIAASMTDEVDVLAATVLHDVVEDTPVTIENIEAEFGNRIAMLVAAESEDKMSDIPSKDSWQIRKQATIDKLCTASREEKIIVLSDKLSNIRAIHRDMTLIGEAIWDRFNQKDKKKHEWYYRSICKELVEFSMYQSYIEYCNLINIVFN